MGRPDVALSMYGITLLISSRSDHKIIIQKPIVLVGFCIYPTVRFSRRRF